MLFVIYIYSLPNVYALKKCGDWDTEAERVWGKKVGRDRAERNLS